MIKNQDMLFTDFPMTGEITETVKKENIKRTFTGGVRINNGMYHTDKEIEEYRKSSLERKLP